MIWIVGRCFARILRHSAVIPSCFTICFWNCLPFIASCTIIQSHKFKFICTHILDLPARTFENAIFNFTNYIRKCPLSSKNNDLLEHRRCMVHDNSIMNNSQKRLLGISNSNVATTVEGMWIAVENINNNVPTPWYQITTYNPLEWALLRNLFKLHATRTFTEGFYAKCPRFFFLRKIILFMQLLVLFENILCSQNTHIYPSQFFFVLHVDLSKIDTNCANFKAFPIKILEHSQKGMEWMFVGLHLSCGLGNMLDRRMLNACTARSTVSARMPVPYDRRYGEPIIYT